MMFPSTVMHYKGGVSKVDLESVEIEIEGANYGTGGGAYGSAPVFQ